MEVPSAGDVGAVSTPLQFMCVPAEPPASSNLYTVVGPPLAQVMTDEQLETLRRQISVYATICRQLVEMHKAQQNAISRSRFGQSSSCDSGFQSLGQRFASRQRWTPSQTQLQILEKLFQQGIGTPSKQKIKEISLELSEYGPVSETNVYNWFQNRRARTKRKQQLGASNNVELESDMDVNSQEEKRACIQKELPNNNNQNKTSYLKWEVDLQQANMAQNGLQLSQRKETVENLAVRYSTADGASGNIVNMKADPMGGLQGQAHVEGSGGDY